MDSVTWWTAFGAIAQAAGALATFAAVAVSLWIALSERRPKLRVKAGLRIQIVDGMAEIDVILITVENVGYRTVQISNIGWRSGWLRRGPGWLKFAHAIQMPSLGSPVPPVLLPVGERVAFYCRTAEFLNASAEKRVALFARKMPWRSGPTPANVRALIAVVGAKRDMLFRVEPTLAKFMVTGEIHYGAEQFNAAADAGA